MMSKEKEDKRLSETGSDEASGGVASDKTSVEASGGVISDKNSIEASGGVASDKNSIEAAGGVASDKTNKDEQNSYTDSGVEYLRFLLGKKLEISDDKAEPEKVLGDLNIEGVAKYIKDGKCKNIITMAGAGISTSAGIPDFRSPGTGLYDNLEKYNLPDPTAVFSIEYFKENPEPFFALAKELLPGEFKPTPCHYFIKMLYDKGLLLRQYTQNIDSLEVTAGLDPDKVVEAHGTFRTSHCTECYKLFTEEWMRERILAGGVPRCNDEDCNGVVKPDIVFFGESLPSKFAKCVVKDFRDCDLLIILGTSLLVQPFASLANRVSDSTPRLYINLESSGLGHTDPLVAMIFGGGLKFDDEDNYRDVFWQGTCDDGCYHLASLLGWGDDLKKLVKEEHEKLDKEREEKKSQTAQSSSKI